MQFLITQVFNCTTHIFKIINVFSSEVFWQIIILTWNLFLHKIIHHGHCHMNLL
jgi:hypothetical protein